ncbi:ATP-binding cassette domain-containing protein [Streptomyces sp. p1417]|uniref:ATP-binding cassette domain-containing protein n=1 Tax=Streptomyces typhae TaxID=2681492 RepID=A0A6L6X7M2_9ACTN|nr:ATP-binding cassette domain-containing protein [Streptomyces typhae]MVO89731.1 ATP-binding cassette domain-containing protein [Streptomyces typhae]
MIQATGLTSNPRQELPPAVDDVSFEARTGRVTTLLGTAGAGKTTVIRLALELQQGRGVTYFRGRPLHRIAHPTREVGVLLGEVPGHPARTVRGHLRMLCAAVGVPVLRADDVLEAVGLVSLRQERLGSLSRGMDRRLGLACALLADPHTLVLDGPTNGLSAKESGWLHGLLRAHATQGGTVLYSTDDPKEAARTADRVVTLDAGRVVADQDASEFARTRLRPRVVVRTPHAARLGALLAKEARARRRSVEVVKEDGNRLSVYGSTCAEVGEAAFRHGILVHRLADEIGTAGPPPTPGPTPRERTGPDSALALARTPVSVSVSEFASALPSAPSPETAASRALGASGEKSVPECTPGASGPGREAVPDHATGGAGQGSSADLGEPEGPDGPPCLDESERPADPARPADPDLGRPADSAGTAASVRTDGAPYRLIPLFPPEAFPAEDDAPSEGRNPAPASGPEPVSVPASASGPVSASGPASTPEPTSRPTSVPGLTPRPGQPQPSSLLPPPIAVRAARSPLRPIRYELRRVCGVGTAYLTVAAALALSAVMGVFLARSGHTPQHRLLAAWPLELPLPPAALGAGLLGALAFGEEFRHPALATDRGTVPRRLGLLTAKLAVAAATALLLAVLTIACDAALLHLVYGPELTEVPADWLSSSVSWMALVVGCAWAGVLAAGVFRSTTAGLAAVLAVPIVVVPLAQKALEGPTVRSAAGLPERLRDLALVQWPFGIERYVAGVVRMLAQPVGSALTLSVTVLLCAFLLTATRSRAH